MSEPELTTLAPGGLPGMPAWAKAAAILAAVLLVLGAAVGNIITSPLQRLERLEGKLVQHEEQTAAQTRLLRQICRNTAKSEFWQEACER